MNVNVVNMLRDCPTECEWLALEVERVNGPQSGVTLLCDCGHFEVCGIRNERREGAERDTDEERGR